MTTRDVLYAKVAAGANRFKKSEQLVAGGGGEWLDGSWTDRDILPGCKAGLVILYELRASESLRWPAGGDGFAEEC